MRPIIGVCCFAGRPRVFVHERGAAGLPRCYQWFDREKLRTADLRFALDHGAVEPAQRIIDQLPQACKGLLREG